MKRFLISLGIIIILGIIIGAIGAWLNWNTNTGIIAITVVVLLTGSGSFAMRKKNDGDDLK